MGLRERVNKVGRSIIENGGHQGGRNGERGGKGKWEVERREE